MKKYKNLSHSGPSNSNVPNITNHLFLHGFPFNCFPHNSLKLLLRYYKNKIINATSISKRKKYINRINKMSKEFDNYDND